MVNQKVVIYLLFSLFVLVLNWEAQQHIAVASHHEEVSQEEAIRLRILANSDAIKDQWLKREIRDEVNQSITEWVQDIEDLEQAKATIEGNLAEIEQIVERQLKSIGLDQTFTVEFNRVDFPTKLYGNLVYPAGEYDAVLITLGEGKGENWWCVLFPPLCFLDFTNGDVAEHEEETEEETSDEVVVEFFVVNLANNVFDWVKNVF
ncbi:stage II sporulation protein R [Bacillus alkalicellulosilyticus]|uniref:stage II sporulation protein R n=1 Tax=Alkalihalobacterium alkalicellulosilyticum TaxID=1912214 RepID=UPI000998881D|nr:stage II sporulation protein R [Bacillus alkalicellulosilyticus]